MHISNTLAHQFKGFRIIEEIQSLFVCQACLLSKQFDNAGIFSLKKNGIGLHRLQCNRFDKLKILVNDALRSDADLVVRFLPPQLVKSLLTCIDSLQVKVYGVEHIVIGNTTFNHVIALMGQTFSTSHNIIKPFAIVYWKYFTIGFGNLIRKFKNIHNGGFASTDKTLTVITCLLFKWSEIKSYAKVQVFTRVADIWFRDNNIESMEISHAAFKTPFLFIRSIRSSTMYSRENVCNTS